MARQKKPKSRDRLVEKALEVYPASEDATGHPNKTKGIRELLEAMKADPTLRDDARQAERAWERAHDYLTRSLVERRGVPEQQLLPGEYFRNLPYMVTGINAQGEPDPGGSVRTEVGSLAEEDRWWMLQTKAHVTENNAFSMKYREHQAFRDAIKPEHRTVGDVLKDLLPPDEDADAEDAAG